MARFTARTAAILFLTTAILFRSGQWVLARLTVMGVFRPHANFRHASSYAVDGEIFTLPELKQCEDLEFVPSLSRIYTACQGNESVRWDWFPAVGNFDKPEVVDRADGRLYSIDVQVGGPLLVYIGRR